MTNHLRERSRELLRAELAESAYDYFAARDFDSVTVDEVAHGIGISRATFFRYFGSKEDAVIEAVCEGQFDFPQVLQEQGESEGDTIWIRLRRMFAPSIQAATTRPDTLRARIRLINSTPALRSRLNERRMSQRLGVVDVLAPAETDRLTARALVASAFALVDVAWSEWVATPGASLPDLLDELFATVGPVERGGVNPLGEPKGGR